MLFLMSRQNLHYRREEKLDLNLYCIHFSLIIFDLFTDRLKDHLIRVKEREREREEIGDE